MFTVSILLLFSSLAQATVLYVGGTTTTPCPGAAGAALGEVTVVVSTAGVIADGTYLTITISPAILASTPVARAGSLASKGYATLSDAGAFKFTFSSGTGSTIVSSGDSVTFGSLVGNAPGYDTTVMASVSASDLTITFSNAAVVIASVNAANCATMGHMLTSLSSLSFGGAPSSSIAPQSFTISNSARPGQNIFPAVS